MLTTLSEQVELAFQRGWVHRELDALDTLDALVEPCRLAEAHALSVRVALARSRLYRILGDHPQAVTVLDEAMAHEAEVPLPERVLLLNYRGCCLIDAGQLAEAVEPVMRAWSQARSSDPASAGIAATNLALTLIDLGDTEGALEWLHRAEWPGQSDFSRAHVLFAHGMLAWRAAKVEDLTHVVHHLGGLRDGFAGSAGDGVRVQALHDLAQGWLHLMEGRACDALLALETAELGFTRDGNRSDVAEVCLAQAKAHRALENDDNADRAMRRGLAAATDPTLRRMLLLEGGAIALDRDRPLEAAERYRQAAEQGDAQRTQLGVSLRNVIERGLERNEGDALPLRHQALQRSHRSLQRRHERLRRGLDERTADLAREARLRREAQVRARAADASRQAALAALCEEVTLAVDDAPDPVRGRVEALFERLERSLFPRGPAPLHAFELGTTVKEHARRLAVEPVLFLDGPLYTRRREFIALLQAMVEHADHHGGSTGIALAEVGDHLVLSVRHACAPGEGTEGMPVSGLRSIAAALGGTLRRKVKNGTIELRASLPRALVEDRLA